MNRFIVKAYLNSVFTNDLKRSVFFFFSESVHNYSFSHFNINNNVFTILHAPSLIAIKERSGSD